MVGEAAGSCSGAVDFETTARAAAKQLDCSAEVRLDEAVGAVEVELEPELEHPAIARHAMAVLISNFFFPALTAAKPL
jgi:hypothetical protein